MSRLTLYYAQITDLSGSSNFVLLALLSLFVGGSDDPLHYTSRRIVLSTIVCLSRAALALFLFYRVIRRGKDARFDGIRESFLVRFWHTVVWRFVSALIQGSPAIGSPAISCVLFVLLFWKLQTCFCPRCRASSAFGRFSSSGCLACR